MKIGELLVGPNLYEYADNSPIIETDPLGLCPCGQKPDPGCVAGCQSDKNWRDHLITAGGLIGGAGCLIITTPTGVFTLLCGGAFAALVNHAFSVSQQEYNDCVNDCPCH
jgi:hypothetical protein